MISDISRQDKRPNIRHNNLGSFWRKLLIMALIVVFIWLCVSSTKMFLIYKEAKRNRIFAENQKIQVESDINELHKKIDQVKTGDGIEEHIREKYPFVKQGERVLVISEDQTVKPIENKTFWQKVRSIFN
jgi:cell division protein FtsB